MIELSVFEAAAFYDCAQIVRDVALPAAALVVDLDCCALGVCRYSEDGTVELLAREEGPGMRMTALDFLPAEGRASILDGIRQSMRRFYRSGGRNDGPAWPQTEGEPPLCSQLDRDFAPDARRIDALLDRGLGHLAGLQILEEDIRILIVGELATYYPAEFALRRRLSPSPFLADGRFVGFTDPPNEIVRIGRELYRENMGHDITLSVLRSDGQAGGIPLMTKGTGASQEPAFCAPVFISVGEPLRLSVDGREQTVELPYKPAEVGDLVEAACRAGVGGVSLLLRRTLSPEQTYEILIRNRGTSRDD